MKVAAQPWWNHPLHREATRALEMRGDGRSTWANPTIYADRAQAEEHVRFLAAVRDKQIAYWDMSADQFAALKRAWRKATMDDDGGLQWWAQVGQHDAERDDDTPDGPREETPDE